jgi:antitoxin (DNA-binding transcriptional repressor) of toxin-antitoxin stability system
MGPVPRITLKQASRTLYGLARAVSKSGAPVVLTRRGVSVAAIVPAGVVNILAALQSGALRMPARFGPEGCPLGAEGGEMGLSPAGAAIPARGANGRARVARRGPGRHQSHAGTEPG